MKFKTICLLLSICSLSYAHAQEGPVAKKDRIYINPKDIAFNNNEMYVSINNNLVQTSAVYSDATGVYVDQNQISWTCGCGYHNTTNVWTCDGCGRRRN